MSTRSGLVIIAGVAAAIVLCACEDKSAVAYKKAAPTLTPLLAEVQRVDKQMRALGGKPSPEGAAAEKVCGEADKAVASIVALDKAQFDVPVDISVSYLQSDAKDFRDAQKKCLDDAVSTAAAAAQFKVDIPGSPMLLCTKACLDGWPKIVESANRLSDNAKDFKVDLPRGG